MNKKLILLMLACIAFSVMGMPNLTKAGRGVVALPAQGSGIFVSWRMMPSDENASTVYQMEVITLSGCGASIWALISELENTTHSPSSMTWMVMVAQNWCARRLLAAPMLMVDM